MPIGLRAMRVAMGSPSSSVCGRWQAWHCVPDSVGDAAHSSQGACSSTAPPVGVPSAATACPSRTWQVAQSPPSRTWFAAQLWPPERTVTRRPSARAVRTARTTSCTSLASVIAAMYS